MSWDDDEATRINQIGPGLVILIGIGPEDTTTIADRMVEKVAGLRIFADDGGRFNRSLEDVAGDALVVSQFTLYANTTRGRRPSFISAGDPAVAEGLYERFAARLAERGLNVKTGSFGAHMTVSLENDGPVTIALSSENWNTLV